MARKCGASDWMESTLPATVAEMALVSDSESPQGQQIQVGDQSGPPDMLSPVGYL